MNEGLYYTDEKNTQILIGLLKAHGISKVVASPGATNVSLVGSLQCDPFFEIYSVVDERSAAYIACGLAEESKEAVVISCTGATASRNYISGLTEAFYRKLPILAITSTQLIGRIGQNIAQVIDRSSIQTDIAKLSINLPVCFSKEDEYYCNLHVNRAILELTRNGGGPVHINLETAYSNNFSVEKLPEVYPIHRIQYGDIFPDISEGRIGVFVGAHSKWNEELKDAVDRFCEKYDAVVLCDQTSNYRGKNRILFSLATSQMEHWVPCNQFDLLIYIGNVSGAYPRFGSISEWRINPDGEVRDTFGHLRYVFQMEEANFFNYYAEIKTSNVVRNNLHEWQDVCKEVNALVSELPFSNIWLASQVAPKIPRKSIVHLGILNTLRSWNFFETPDDVFVFSNTGGFGIDGILSASIGSSLCHEDTLVYCILGDLAFFYDMNSLGNRHVKNNLRILLINNGKGTEFRNYNHRCARFGEDADLFMAAGGHNGNKSDTLVRHYAEDLGFDYIAIHDKEDSKQAINYLTDSKTHTKPLIIEAFVDSNDETAALYTMYHLIVDENHLNDGGRKIGVLENSMRSVLKSAIGEKGLNIYRNIRYGKDRES